MKQIAPERALMWAIIFQGVMDAIDPLFPTNADRRSVERVKREANDWLNDKRSNEQGSLLWALSHVADNPQDLQKKIIEWTRGREKRCVALNHLIEELNGKEKRMEQGGGCGDLDLR